MVCFWQATKFIFAAFARQKEASHLDFCRPQELLQTLYTLKWQASKNILSHHVHHVHIWHHLTNVTNMTDVISQHSTNTLIYHIRRNQMFHWPIAACIAPAVPWVPQHYTQKILKFQQKKNHILAFLLHTSPSENIVMYQWIIQCSNVSTTPLRQWGFWQCLPFSWTNIAGTPLP